MVLEENIRVSCISLPALRGGLGWWRGGEPEALASQIFYVPKNQALVKANVRFYASCWPWVPSGSALRAGALALAPIFTGLRAGRRARLAREQQQQQGLGTWL